MICSGLLTKSFFFYSLTKKQIRDLQTQTIQLLSKFKAKLTRPEPLRVSKAERHFQLRVGRQQSDRTPDLHQRPSVRIGVVFAFAPHFLSQDAELIETFNDGEATVGAGFLLV